MDQQSCPYLGTLDVRNKQQPGVAYPSFENHCFADPKLVGDTLLLGDQATYCLFGGCRHCPRFQQAQRFTRTGSIPRTAPISPSEFAPLPSLTYPREPDTESIKLGILDSEPLDPDLRAMDVSRSDEAFDLIDFAVDSGPELDAAFDEDEFDGGPRFSPAWLLAGTLFLGTFLCVSVMFFLISFQAVRSNLGDFFAGSADPEQVYAVAPAQPRVDLGQATDEQSSGANSSIVLVVTATSEPVTEDGDAAEVAVAQAAVEDVVAEDVAEDVAGEEPPGTRADEDVESVPDEVDELVLVAPTPTVDFPKAVTPTPIVVVLDNLDGNAPSVDARVVDAADVSASAGDDAAGPRFIPAPTSTPAPEINVNLLVPTPPDGPPDPAANDEPLIEQVNEIAAAEPEEEASDADADDAADAAGEEDDEEDDEPTPTPTPTWPPPLVLFGVKDEALMEGGCTEIFWTVENVRAVYVENVPVNGTGDREECIRDESETFVLTVVLPDGGTENHTVTVELLLPTATPTATPTFTPVPIPTATWTPIPPPPTPTPAFVYGVSLTAAGQKISCSAGATCELGMTVKNIGNTTDNVAVYVEQGGEWLPTLCSAVGNCSVDRLVIAGVGEENTATLTLKFDIPNGSPPRTESYAFRASSEGSGGSARSDSITVEVNVP